MNKYIYRMRRERLGRAIGEGAVALISGAQNKARNGDVQYPFRQTSDMLYLSGWTEPDSFLMILGGVVPRSIFFCLPKDPLLESWTGKRFGPEEAMLHFGFDEAYSNAPSAAMSARVIALLSSCHHLFTPNGVWGDDSPVLSNIIDAYTKNSAQKSISRLSILLDEHRVIKDDHEIELMRKACMISASAHRDILKLVRPWMNECALEAEITYRFRKHGGDPLHAYPPIVASGINACTLHYTENNKIMNSGDLVLVDAGCEYQGYASDITRTFPVNGKFSPAQHELYALVLAAQKAAIEKAQRGNSIHVVNNAARATITRGLVALGFTRGPWISPRATKACARFFPHGTSHFLGLDVHDVGDYQNRGKNQMRLLEPGMVITVEPGIYIPPAPDIPEKYWNIGIRIEDDVLITRGGPCVLSAEAPKEIAEIEANMKQGEIPFFM